MKERDIQQADHQPHGGGVNKPELHPPKNGTNTAEDASEKSSKRLKTGGGQPDTFSDKDKACKKREYQKRWYGKNLQKVREQQKRYRVEHKEQIRERRIYYKQEHDAQIKEQARRFYQAHRDKIKERSKLYRQEKRRDPSFREKERVRLIIYRQRRREQLRRRLQEEQEQPAQLPSPAEE